MIWLLLLAATPSTGRPCKAPPPDLQVKVSFKAGSTVDDLARFASAILCQPWDVPAAARKHTLKISVDGEVYARQLPALFHLLTDSASAEKAPPLAPEPSTECNPRLVSSIVPVDPWTRKIPAASKEQLLGCAPMQVRVVPNFKDGVAQGFKLFGIRQLSLGEALAFQNGDVVLAVNGSELSTPEQALQAYAKLQQASELKFAIVRKGEPRTITWQIR